MSNLILSIITFLLTVLTEFLFSIYQGLPSTIPFQNYIGLFIAIFLFSFIKGYWLRLAGLTMILVLSFFQMMHIQFYSMPVYPNAIYLFFTESSEIFYTLKENLHFFFIPIILIIPSVLIIWIGHKRLPKLKSSIWVSSIFIFYLVFNPIRTYMTGNTWGRQPSGQEFMGMNLYLSISYFSGRILPFKMLGGEKQKSFKPQVKFTKTKSFDGNIILVLGESLSANHLSLLGYNVNTTPYLLTLKENPNFYYTKAISSGVSTDVAVAMFMNSTYGLRGSEDVIKGKNCLFNLAKDSGFKTYFFSSQSEQQLRYISNSICTKKIDHYKSLDLIQPKIDNPNKADDRITIREIPKTFDEESKQFLVLHQRGSHSPYALRYSDPYFSLTKDKKKNRVIHYDNSVLEFDKFMQELITLVQSYNTPTIVLYLSDHGEGLGEEGVWGHAALKKPSIEIPFLVYAHSSTLKLPPNLPKIPTQFNISLYISKLLGHNPSPNYHEFPKNFQILGNDIDGFSGYLEIKMKDTGEYTIHKKDI